MSESVKLDCSRKNKKKTKIRPKIDGKKAKNDFLLRKILSHKKLNEWLMSHS